MGKIPILESELSSSFLKIKAWNAELHDSDVRGKITQKIWLSRYYLSYFIYEVFFSFIHKPNNVEILKTETANYSLCHV